MALVDNVISKAREYIGVSENPPESNNVVFNTDYYGREVFDNGGITYPWCVVFLWDIFRMSGAGSIFCDGMKTASTEAVLTHYKNKGMLFSTGKRGDIVLIITDAAGRGRNVNHAGLVTAVNGDGTYETIEGNTGSGNIANGGMVMNRTRSLSGRGYKIVGFARPSYEGQSSSTDYNEIPISAKLTIVGSGIRVRMSPNTSAAVIKNLEEGAVVKATGRIASRHNPWFHIEGGYISGNFVSGWVKDYNDNKRWWYVEKDYKYAKSQWKNIAGKDYCFGKDSYLFVNCYIKSAVNGTYYWVDDDGVYQNRYDTTSPSRKYRIVENYKNENAL